MELLINQKMRGKIWSRVSVYTLVMYLHLSSLWARPSFLAEALMPRDVYPFLVSICLPLRSLWDTLMVLLGPEKWSDLCCMGECCPLIMTLLRKCQGGVQSSVSKSHLCSKDSQEATEWRHEWTTSRSLKLFLLSLSVGFHFLRHPGLSYHPWTQGSPRDGGGRVWACMGSMGGLWTSQMATVDLEAF